MAAVVNDAVIWERTVCAFFMSGMVTGFWHELLANERVFISVVSFFIIGKTLFLNGFE